MKGDATSLSRIGNARRGLVFGIMNNIFGVILPFISRTIIIYTLGNEYLGLGGLFTSIINVISISELGFGAAVSYILYKPIAENDEEKVCAILKFTRKCFFVIGMVVLVAGLAIMPFLKSLISGDVPDGINIYLLYIFYLINVVSSYVMFSYKRILFSANQRYDIETNIASFTLIAQYIVQIIVLILLKNYYIYVLIVPIATIVNNLLCQAITKKMYPRFTCKGNISKEEVKLLKEKVAGSFFSKLGDTVYLSVDNIVISAVFGLLILGKYSNYYYIITSLVALFAIIHNTLRPIIGNCIVTEQKDINFDRFLKLNNIYIWITAFCSCCLLCLYQDFISVWIGENGKFSMFLVFLFVIYFFAGRLSAVVTLFLESAGLWWEIRFIALTAAGINLALNIALSLTIGLPGILISSIVSTLGVTMIGHISVLFKNYFDKKQLFKYIKSMMVILLSAFLIIFAVFLIVNNISANGWFELIFKGVATVVIFGVLYLILSFRNTETRSTWQLAAQMVGIDKIFKKGK